MAPTAEQVEEALRIFQSELDQVSAVIAEQERVYTAKGIEQRERLRREKESVGQPHGEGTMSTTGRYSIDFEQSDNPGTWERHLVMNSDVFSIAEDFYFASVDAVSTNALATILGVRLFDHELHVPVIEYRA